MRLGDSMHRYTNGWCGASTEGLGGRNLPQSFVIFPPSFPTDFLGKPAEKFTNSDHRKLQPVVSVSCHIRRS